MLSANLDNEINSIFLDWETDEPPLIILLASIGRWIFINLDEINDKNILFELIEEGITSDDEKLSNATATGMIEAIVNRSFSNESRWEEFENGLLSKSKEYALAWRNQ